MSALEKDLRGTSSESRAFDLLRRYAFVVVVIATIVCLSQILKSLQASLPGQISSPLLLIGVVMCAWYGGWGPGLLAAILAFLNLEYFFIPPLYTFALDWTDVPRVIAFLGTAIVVSMLVSQITNAQNDLARTQGKLRAARTIQERLYPSRTPSLPGLDIAGASFPANTVGGDYFDYITLPGGTLGVVIGDVSGHGLGPALLMAETRANLRAMASTRDDVGEILTLTNRFLVEDTEEEFVTVWFGSIDTRKNSLIYAGAGHNAYLLELTGSAQRLHSTSLPLGLEKDLVVPCSTTFPLLPGQILLLFTDGVYETQSRDGTWIGIGRCLEIVHEYRHKPAQEIIDCLQIELQDFSERQPQKDDITMVIVKIQSSS